MDVQLPGGKYAVIDDCLFDTPLNLFVGKRKVTLRICDHNWSLLGETGRKHVVAPACGTLVGLHRAVMQVADSSAVDHIDGDVLNNRRSNLRICTNQQNLRNMRSKGGSSKYKGVSRAGMRFQARIMVDGVDVRRKSFIDELEAALQYDDWAIELFGEFAWLNRENFSELLSEVSR